MSTRLGLFPYFDSVTAPLAFFTLVSFDGTRDVHAVTNLNPGCPEP